MANANRYASISEKQTEAAGQVVRNFSASRKLFLYKVCEEHLKAGKSLNADIDGAAGAVLKAKGLI